MEEKKITEQESLELIARMIESTKENLEVGNGNQFLYWGYFSVFLSVVIFACVYFTGNLHFTALWFLMFVFWLVLSLKTKKPKAVTYIDRAINSVWQVLGAMFVIATVSLMALSYYTGHGYMTFMMPFSILFLSIGSSISGVILRNRMASYFPLVGSLVGFYAFVGYFNSIDMAFWQLLFGLAAVFSFIIPGHLLNRKPSE